MQEALSRRDSLEPAEAAELAVRAKTDAAAREELVLRSMGLISNAAKRFRGALKEDAFGEASVAFLRAIDTYDPGAGNFVVWASFLMWAHLRQASALEQAQAHQRYEPSIDTRYGSSDLLQTLLQTLARAIADGAMTERQARIFYDSKCAGEKRSVILARYRISRGTYHRALNHAEEALEQYVR